MKKIHTSQNNLGLQFPVPSNQRCRAPTPPDGKPYAPVPDAVGQEIHGPQGPKVTTSGPPQAKKLRLETNALQDPEKPCLSPGGPIVETTNKLTVSPIFTSGNRSSNTLTRFLSGGPKPRRLGFPPFLGQGRISFEIFEEKTIVSKPYHP